MVSYIMGTARIASLPPWMRSKATSKAILCDLIYDAFVGLEHKLTCIWTSVCNDGFKTILLPLLHLSLSCINSFCTPMYVELLVNLCNMWLVCWIMYDLGCMLGIIRDPSWYSMDYRVYMGSSMIVRPLQWLALYLCSYKLVGSATAVLLKFERKIEFKCGSAIQIKRGNYKELRWKSCQNLD